MKKTETLFIILALLGAVIVTGALLWNSKFVNQGQDALEYSTNKYGAFLVNQYAITVNDFETASKYSKQLKDEDLAIIQNAKILSEFLDGSLPESAKLLKEEKNIPSQLIYSAYLLSNDDWDGIYSVYKNDESALVAPLRIWSGIAIGKTADTFKFIENLKTNDSWKAFVRGQVYAETKKPDEAAKEFAKVLTDFMNINDYLYIKAFYTENNMEKEAKTLHTDFTKRPGGMFMLDSKINPKWDEYAGFKKALGFSMVQNVSHTQVIMYSDLSLLMLRFASIAIGDSAKDNDAINYYLGLYFYNNGGGYKAFFDKIDKKSPFYPFALMKEAEKNNDIKRIETALKSNPLFIPAINKVVAKNIQAGNKRKAIKVIDKALSNENLTEIGRAFFLKTRAGTHLIFKDLKNAQKDIHKAAEILRADIGILATQARIWAAENRELGTAYEYAITLVQQNPTDIESWDVLGMVVWAKEGPQEALEIFEKVGKIANTSSALFEHLGDLHMVLKNNKLATDAYVRAIDLSDDGQTVKSDIENKLRKIK